MLRNSIKSTTSKRRSSFPASKISNIANFQASINTARALKSGKIRPRDHNTKNIKDKNIYYTNKYRVKKYDSIYQRSAGQQSLFDIHSLNITPYRVVLNLGNQRRFSVPQDIFIHSLNNYTA